MAVVQAVCVPHVAEVRYPRFSSAVVLLRPGPLPAGGQRAAGIAGLLSLVDPGGDDSLYQRAGVDVRDDRGIAVAFLRDVV